MIFKLLGEPFYYSEGGFRSLEFLKDGLIGEDSAALRTLKQCKIIIPTEFT